MGNLKNKPRYKTKKTTFSNIEIVTLAVYLLGGRTDTVCTEDVANKANEIAPGRFTWTKYPDQINIEIVRVRLSDAKNASKGGYLIGSSKTGWTLTKEGLKFATSRIKDLTNLTIPPPAQSFSESEKEFIWQRRERARMLASPAFATLRLDGADAVSPNDAESFFRVDDYVVGEARTRKLRRITDNFGNDPELGEAIKILANKVRKK